MSVLRGVGIGDGIAHGPVVHMAEALPAPSEDPRTTEVAVEQARALKARSVVAADLQARADLAGGAAQEVLEAQAMIAEDPTLTESVDELIDAGCTAERAVHEAFLSFRATLEAAGGYLGERAADLDDIAQRVLAELMGVPAPGVPNPGHPFVLVARDLAPADTALLNLDQVLALVTTDGGPTSHTAILAREKGIVALVGAVDAASLVNGATVIVDAAAGTIISDPSTDELDRATRRAAELRATADGPTGPGALRDGTPVALLANLGRPGDAADAVARGAEGVGLFRTEFLFLSATQAPTIQQQRTAYEELLRAFPGRKVVVRLLDAGADKPLAFLNDAHEENPALGLRGLRALQASEAILREQLTALAEADAVTDAELWVMAPMVTTVDEAATFTQLAHEHGIRTAGVMIEVPAAALLADRLLPHTDFASIGTNDLTQYAMAADRLLGSVAAYQDPWHPAVLRLVRDVGAAGATHDVPVSICGEAAADPLLALVLVGLGAGSLSMAPAALADVRRRLAAHSLADVQKFAALALDTDSAAQARAAVEAAVQAAESATTP